MWNKKILCYKTSGRKEGLRYVIEQPVKLTHLTTCEEKRKEI